MTKHIGVAILGSTGSIGLSALDVLQHNTDRFRVVALAANRNDNMLFKQCLLYEPALAVMADADAADRLYDRLRLAGRQIEVLSGISGLESVSTSPDADYVIAAIVGAAGLIPTLAAARARKRVLLANKEILVMAGSLFMSVVQEQGTELLPLDSEHNAIFQCLPLGFPVNGLNRLLGVQRIILTGSGGPFRLTPFDILQRVTPEQACSHPNWTMGRKISVDSATMMNKGLEVIEAHWLFAAKPGQIEVVIHPQSIIHSMVEYEDGSVLAQLGNPDMRIPIAHALAWPQRLKSGVAFLDFSKIAQLEFQQPDLKRFPCLQLAFSALKAGGTVPAILNAANEVAVQAFLERRINFTDIATAVNYTLERVARQTSDHLSCILADDTQARQVTSEWIASIGDGSCIRSGVT
jgi:1-deoxy-D-xylulose-5-phosphate reductoisomerase